MICRRWRKFIRKEKKNGRRGQFSYLRQIYALVSTVGFCARSWAIIGARTVFISSLNLVYSCLAKWDLLTVSQVSLLQHNAVTHSSSIHHAEHNASLSRACLIQPREELFNYVFFPRCLTESQSSRSNGFKMGPRSLLTRLSTQNQQDSLLEWLFVSSPHFKKDLLFSTFFFL